jgi:hypothetical protein
MPTSRIWGKIAASHRDIWELVREKATVYLGRMPSEKFDNESDMREAGRGVPWQALAWLVTQDVKYLEGARKWMLRICEYPHWEHNNSLAAGECLFGVSVGYDWLHGVLQNSERKAVREKLVYQAEAMRKGPPVHRDMWLANHNHVEHLGLAAAGFALYGEVDQAGEWIRQADLVFRTVLRTSSRDGSSTEGHQYWAYSAESILRYAELARDLLGENLYTAEWLKSVPDFIIHSMLPDFSSQNCVMSFGDSHRTYESHGPAHILYRVAAEYRNAHAQWLALEMQRRGVGRNAYCGWANLLWYDETLEAKPIWQLPRFWNFDDIGWITSRSGWDPNAVMVGFKCGPMHGRKAQQYYDAHPESSREIGGGHGHPDVNSFQIYAHGKWLAIDPQYERPKWTRNHNTVLVNGKGQLGEGQTWFDRKAVFTAHAGSAVQAAEHNERYVYLVGDAGNIYPRQSVLLGFKRHFLFVRPDFIVIVDQLTAGAAARYEWLMQVEETLDRIGPRSFVARNGEVGMDVVFLLPETLVASVSGKQLRAVPPPSAQCVIATVLHPRSSGQPAGSALVESWQGSLLSLRIGVGDPRMKVDFDLSQRKVAVTAA